MQNPTTIFFDLDETLIENVIPIQNLFAGMYANFQEQLGAGNEEAFFAELRLNAAGLWNSMFTRETSPEDQFVECFAKSVLALRQHNMNEATDLGEQMFTRFNENSANNVRLHTGATQTLSALRKAGYTTGIITNGIEQLQLGKIHKLALEKEVDHVVVSAQARAHKPDSKVFELALQRADVPAHSAWQIGDHATNDVAGAIRAGMSGVFFDPCGSRRDAAFIELEVEPTHVISSLPQVLELID